MYGSLWTEERTTEKEKMDGHDFQTYLQHMKQDMSKDVSSEWRSSRGEWKYKIYCSNPNAAGN